MLSRGYIDERNLFVYGGSGGGVLTSWIVGRTGRFTAAVVKAPVTNWLSFVGTTDGSGWYRNFEKLPWEDPEEHLRRSTLMYVGNVTTPTLLMTGERDLRTPMEQTEQYYRALKLRKVPTAMIRLTDSWHSRSSPPTKLPAGAALPAPVVRTVHGRGSRGHGPERPGAAVMSVTRRFVGAAAAAILALAGAAWAQSAAEMGPQAALNAMGVVGYADRMSVAPGETIRFMVSSELPTYRAEIVRLIHGDANPNGPGIKEELVEAPANGDYPGRRQALPLGSYVTVPDAERRCGSAGASRSRPGWHRRGRGVVGWVGRAGRAGRGDEVGG